MALDYDAGPLVWIDCEMTGLIPRKDTLLEIAVIITDGKLNPVDDGIEFVIRRDKETMDGMNEWCIKQHGQSGLTEACLNSPHTIEDVAKAVLGYIRKWIPQQRTGVLAGNSVHVDKAFLIEEMPEVVEWLHYRIVGGKTTDVSTIKELYRRWYRIGQPNERKQNEGGHRALDDIRGSIQELDWYRQNIFVEPAQLTRKPGEPITGTAT